MDSSLSLIHKWVNEEYGVIFRSNRMDFFSGIVEERKAICGFKENFEYYNYLLNHSSEAQEFIENLTTHYTYFFRNQGQMKELAEVIIPQIENSYPKQVLKILSLGCSTGEETYTLAMQIFDKLSFAGNWNIEILGIDISESKLEIARKGIYSSDKLQDVPESWKAKYFTDMGNNCYQVSSMIREVTNFSKGNILKDVLPGNLNGIFCRNVLIYFNLEWMEKIYAKLADSLQTGGFLFLGSSEFLDERKYPFKTAEFQHSIYYLKE